MSTHLVHSDYPPVVNCFEAPGISPVSVEMGLGAPSTSTGRLTLDPYRKCPGAQSSTGAGTRKRRRLLNQWTRWLPILRNIAPALSCLPSAAPCLARASATAGQELPRMAILGRNVSNRLINAVQFKSHT